MDPVRQLIVKKYFKSAKSKRVTRATRPSAADLLIKEMANKTKQKKQQQVTSLGSPRKKRPRDDQSSKPPMTLDVAKARAARSLRRLVLILRETKDAQLMPCEAVQEALAQLFEFPNGGAMLRRHFDINP
jgi:predicted nucleic acid-binding protein